ncbi:MAG TPA: FGGY-family carbohydrate kinase [Spirochaetia bacterium]|nr:FGGY-family carbohydrate kinase [Spirochaetia bacterium]
MGLMCGIDVGTTGAKAALFTAAGELVSDGYAEYPVEYPHGGWAEQDPELWWKAVCSSIGSMLGRVPISFVPASIEAVAVSAQAPTMLPLDARMCPVRPALIWMDRRADREALELAGQFGEDELFVRTGNRPDPYYVAPKILWFRKNEPEAFAKTRWFASITGFINYRLTGVLTMDPVHAALLGLRSWEGREWLDEVSRYCGVEAGRFPEVLAGDAVIGEVTRSAADECGLPAGTMVVNGNVDGSVAALEAGAFEPGTIAEMTGTSTVLLMPNRSGLTHRSFTAMPHAIEGISLLIAAMSATGASLKWFRDELGEGERVRAAQTGVDAYDLLGDLAATAEAGSGGVVFLPYMMGERAPIWDSNARGVFFGLTLSTTRAQMVRSVMEATAFALRHNVEVAREAGIQIEELRSVGGGARSELWNQIKADILGIPVAIPERSGGAVFGDAVLAGMGAGLIDDPEAFVSRVVRIRRHYEPDSSVSDIYEAQYRTYREIYTRLRPVFDRAIGGIRDAG